MKKIPVYLPRLALASSLLCSLTAMADPSVVSAVKAGNEIFIHGSSFGTKSTAAPTFFQPFTALAEDDTPTDAGFDSWVNRGAEAVTLLDGVGGGSLRVDPSANGSGLQLGNAMAHIGKYLPASTSEVRLAFYFRVYGSTTRTNGTQIKFARAGVHESGDNGADDYHSTNLKFYPSLWMDEVGDLGVENITTSYRSDTTPFNFYVSDSGGGSSGVPIVSQPEHTYLTDWTYAEVYYKLNDDGVSNGIYRILLNGFLWVDRDAIELRTDPGQYLSYIQPLPSIEMPDDPDEWEYALSRVYIDTGADSAAHVYLCNTSTAAACTKKFVLPPSAWTSGTDITVTAENIPSGYNWVYVTNAAGEVNSSGYAYTIPGC